MQYIIFLTIFIVTNIFFSVSGQSWTVVECTEKRTDIYNLTREVICKPRKTLVKLIAHPGRELIPDVISIDRCAGRCGSRSSSCTAIESTLEKVVVQGMQIETMDLRCYEIEVEKHTRCRCTCSLNERECNSNENFNAETCACE